MEDIQPQSLTTQRQMRNRIDRIVHKIEQLTDTTIELVELSRQSPTQFYISLRVNDPTTKINHTVDIGFEQSIMLDATFCAHMITAVIFTHVLKRPGYVWFN